MSFITEIPFPLYFIIFGSFTLVLIYYAIKMKKNKKYMLAIICGFSAGMGFTSTLYKLIDEYQVLLYLKNTIFLIMIFFAVLTLILLVIAGKRNMKKGTVAYYIFIISFITVLVLLPLILIGMYFL